MQFTQNQLRFFVMGCIGFLLLFMSSCASPVHQANRSQFANERLISITVSIVGDSQTGTILPKTSYTSQTPVTVLDVLLTVAKENKISVNYTGSGMTAYIEGIADLHEYDLGPRSGWQFYINGELAMQGAGSYELQPNDEITWMYTEDFSVKGEPKL